MTGSAILIGEDELSTERLSKVLEAGFMEHSVDDDGDIYVKDGIEFPMWVSLRNGGSIIRIFTYVKFKDEDFDYAQALELVERMNRDFYPNQIYLIEDCLYSAYSIFPIDGITEKAFIALVRRCSSSFASAVRTCDENDLIG